MVTREGICRQISRLTRPTEEVLFIDNKILETQEFNVLQRDQSISGKAIRTDYQVVFPLQVQAVVLNISNQMAFVLRNDTLILPGGKVRDKDDTKSDRERAFDAIHDELDILCIDPIRLRIATDNPFNFLRGGCAKYHFFWAQTDSEEKAQVIWIPRMLVMKELRIFHDKGKFFNCFLDTTSYFCLLDFFMYN